MDDAPSNDHWAVYNVVYRHAFASDEGCWCSRKTVAAEARIDHNRLTEIMKWLIGEGWIHAVERPGFTTVYRCRVDHPSAFSDTHPSGNPDTTPPENRTPPLRDPGHKQEPINKNPLTRKTPLTPQRGETPAPKTKRLTPAEKKAQTLISWIDGIPPDFAGRKEQIKAWLEERYDKKHRTDPWGSRQLSAKALREMIAIDSRIADEYLAQAAQAGWLSLGHAGKNKLVRDIARDLGLAKGPGLANNDRPRPGPPLKPLV